MIGRGKNSPNLFSGMLDSEVFSDGVPATIDASDPSECPVIKDPSAVIAFDR